MNRETAATPFSDTEVVIEFTGNYLGAGLNSPTAKPIGSDLLMVIIWAAIKRTAPFQCYRMFMRQA